MKPATPALIALLASGQFYMVDLYTFFLANGQTLYYSTGDADIVYGGITYVCGGDNGPIFDRKGNRATSHWKAGTQVDTLSFDVMPRGGTVDGVPFLTACRQGVFDGAQFQLQRAYMPNYGNTADDLVIIFYGRVAEIDAGRSIATFAINSHLELLNQNMPRNVYQSNCINTLYDASCALLKSLFTVTGALVSGSTVSSLNTNLLQNTGYFDLGVITFTSGPNDGISRSVKSFVGGSPSNVSIYPPLDYAPSSGDTFTVYPGCDHTMTTCAGKFNNLANFRGTPYIPDTSTAV